MSRDYLQHGRRHGPNGSDPIPGLSGGGAAWFYGTRSTSQTIPGSSSRRVAWTTHETSDSSVFSVTTSTTTDDTVNGLQAGIYIAQMNMVWSSPASYQHYGQIISDFFTGQGLGHSPLTDSASANTEVVANARAVADMTIAVPSSVPGEISVLATNADGSSHNVISCTYMICFLPNSTFIT